MTITIAQHTGSDAMGGTATNPTITYASSQTAGNLNVIGINWGGAVTLNTVTDSQGNSYTVEAAGITGFAFAYCLSIAAHAAGNVVTANFSGATSSVEAWIIESHTTSGSWTVGPVDHGSGASGTAMTTAGVTLSSQPTLGFAFAISGNGSTVTAGSGWTGLDALSGSGTPLGVGIMGMYERVKQAGGSMEIQSGNHGTTVTATLPCEGVGLCREPLSL